MTLLLTLFFLIRPPAESRDTLLLPQRLYSEATLLSQYLFNGPRYHVYDRNADTHQFHKTRDLLTGTLRYDGHDYGPFEMHYDVALGVLVIRQPANKFLVRLDTSKIERFTLDGDYFETVADHPVLKRGIYQTLHDGETKLVCRRKKARIEVIENMKIIPIFYETDTYFAFIGGTYRSISSKKDVYRFFPGHKPKIRAHFRRNRYSFRKNKEKHLVELVKIIDTPAS